MTNVHEDVCSSSHKGKGEGREERREGEGEEREERKENTYLYLSSILEMDTQGKRQHLTEPNGFPTATSQTMQMLWRSISDLKGGEVTGKERARKSITSRQAAQ